MQCKQSEKDTVKALLVIKKGFSIMRFRLQQHIFAGRSNQDVIVLDCEKDRYYSINGIAADLLQTILEQEFAFFEGKYTCVLADQQNNPDQLTNMISHFLSIGIVKVCDERDSPSLVSGPLLPGGLSNYTWDYKASMKSFSSVSKIALIKALISLMRMEYARTQYGIKGIMEILQRQKNFSDKRSTYDDRAIQELSDSVDLACALYPKKIYCLGWASTFTLLALKRGISANLVVGVQAIPFYAHAWAEVDGKVINDDERVRIYLTPLVAIPN